MENILLIKGWRRYTWADIFKTEPTDTLRQFEDLKFKGYVTYYYKTLKKPVTIINLSNPLNTTITDKTGTFSLNDEDMIIEHSKKLNIIVAGKDIQYYQINALDPYRNIDKILASQLSTKDYATPLQESSQHLQLAGNQHAIQLKEVKINGNNDGSFYSSANACGDYVCRYGILNCPNHPNERDNRPPIKGESYYMPTGYGTANMKIAYQGCTLGKYTFGFKGIYAAQEFYPPDYAQESPSAPEYVSTLYWKNQLKVSATNEAEVSFFTSDITGRFKIVVQGVTTNDVTYGEASFNVIKAK